MVTLNCKMYANTAENSSLSDATFIGEHHITLPTIFDLDEFINICPESTRPITNALGETTELYSRLLSICEIDKTFALLQYNREGEMGGVEQVQSLFNYYTISSSTKYESLIFDFGGDNYIYECPGSGRTGLYSKDTEELLVDAHRPLIFGCFQYNVEYNNLSFGTCFFYDDKLIPVSFDIVRDSSYVHYVTIARSSELDLYLPDDIGDDITDKIIPNDDPYEPGGNSGDGGGEGDFDGTGDDIDIPDPPTLSAVDTGFITLFNPSVAELRSLCSYMWSNFFDLATFKKIFADPMDCILGLSIVPVAVPNGESATVKVGNISTGVSMTKAASQYVEVDCGTLNVNEYWGAYLDYDPYTKAEIYLPYIGTHPIAVDDIMRKSVTVKYHVDILSGACVAFVKCGGSVLYSFIGQCSSSIPISGNDWTNVINGVINIAGSIGTMVATGGLSAPISASAGAAQNAQQSLSYKKTMSVINGSEQIASTVVNSMKPAVEKSGAMSGTGGMLAVQTPYLILTRPRQALPAGQNSFMGYPSFITRVLGSLKGYTEVEAIHLNGIPATDEELAEIENMLKKGVIL